MREMAIIDFIVYDIFLKTFHLNYREESRDRHQYPPNHDLPTLIQNYPTPGNVGGNVSEYFQRVAKGDISEGKGMKTLKNWPGKCNMTLSINIVAPGRKPLGGLAQMIQPQKFHLIVEPFLH